MAYPTIEEFCSESLYLKPILKFLKLRWSGLDKIKPIGFDELMKEYCDHDGHEEYKDRDNEDFDILSGVIAAAGGQEPIPMYLQLPNVVYNECEQGQNHLEMFIFSLVLYGEKLGERRIKMELKGEFQEAIKSIEEHGLANSMMLDNLKIRMKCLDVFDREEK